MVAGSTPISHTNKMSEPSSGKSCSGEEIYNLAKTEHYFDTANFIQDEAAFRENYKESSEKLHLKIERTQKPYCSGAQT